MTDKQTLQKFITQNEKRMAKLEGMIGKVSKTREAEIEIELNRLYASTADYMGRLQITN